MYRHMMYWFPLATIEPGQDWTDKIEVKGLFRAQKLLMVAWMDVVRGRYWIKRSHLGWLDRKHVVDAYTEVRRWRNKSAMGFTRGRTVVVYDGPGGKFERSYLPSSVVYEDVDPLEYIELTGFYINRSPQMGAGMRAPAILFGSNNFGHTLQFEGGRDLVMTMQLKNTADVPVRVGVTVMGVGGEDPVVDELQSMRDRIRDIFR